MKEQHQKQPCRSSFVDFGGLWICREYLWGEDAVEMPQQNLKLDFSKKLKRFKYKKQPLNRLF